MISDQSCPLCGEELRGIERGLNNPHSTCPDARCSLYAVIFENYKIRELRDQITRIRQEAKQEVFDELLEFTVKSDLPVDSKVIIRNYLEKRWLK